LAEGREEDVFRRTYELFVEPTERANGRETICSVAKRLKCGRNTVARRIRKYKEYARSGAPPLLHQGRPVALEDNEIAKIDEMYTKGATLEKMETVTGVPLGTIYSYLRRTLG
jgi:transposase